jgi:hypothetical protein
MNVLTLIFIALLCGVAAAAAVWTVAGLAENATYLLRRRNATPAADEASAAKKDK